MRHVIDTVHRIETEAGKQMVFVAFLHKQ